MRISFCLSLILLSALGAAFAQDTNFASGPQYLMNHGSPLFAQPISTPSYSLAGPMLEVGASNATGDLTAGAESETRATAPSDSRPQVDLFPIYYGAVPVNVVEISFAEASSPRGELPASILDTGVGQMTTAQALRERGYGVTLPEAAAYGKARTGHATRVYTNADIDRLHSGS